MNVSKKHITLTSILEFPSKCIWLLILATLIFLSFASFLITSTVSANDAEKVSFENMTPVQIALLASSLIAFVFLIWITIKNMKSLKRLNDQKVFRLVRYSMLSGIGFIGLIWVFSTQFIPGSDQLLVQNIAQEFSQNNYSSCKPGKYLSTFPHQLGLVWFSFCIGKIFGFGNFLVFQIINVISLVVIYEILLRLGAKIGLSNSMQILILVFGYIFCPLILMTSFVYGNLISLAAALIAMHQEVCFIKSNKLRHLSICCIAASFSVLIKSNGLVIVIAMIITALLFCRKNNFIIILVFVAALGLAILVAQEFIIYASEKITNENLREGVSNLGFIAMGLDDKSDRGPGWYSGLNIGLYNEAGFAKTEHAALAYESISKSIDMFINSPGYLSDFFYKKEVSQWCNPDFQTWWTPQIRESQINLPDRVKNFISPEFQQSYTPLLKFFQTSIYVFSVIFLIKNRSVFPKSPASLLLGLAFLGGFLCHTLWEAKTYYTITYFVLLFPYAVMGIRDSIDFLNSTCYHFIDNHHYASSFRRRSKNDF